MNLLEIHGHLQKLPVLVTTLTGGLVYLTTTLSAPLAAAPPSLSTSLSLFPLCAPVLRDQARRWCCEIRRDGGAARSDKMVMPQTEKREQQPRWFHACCMRWRRDAASAVQQRTKGCRRSSTANHRGGQQHHGNSGLQTGAAEI